MLALVDIHDLKYITVNQYNEPFEMTHDRLYMSGYMHVICSMFINQILYFQHNLGEFYNRTRPTYQFAYCRLEFLDCLRMWRIVKSTIGIDLFWPRIVLFSIRYETYGMFTYLWYYFLLAHSQEIIFFISVFVVLESDGKIFTFDRFKNRFTIEIRNITFYWTKNCS